MNKNIQITSKSPVTATHNGVKIYQEGTIRGFFDIYGHLHIRNSAKRGGTLAALREDIDWYIKNEWVGEAAAAKI